MNNSLCPTTIKAWVRLVKIKQVLLTKVETDLKAAGLPPLACYDALLELARSDTGELTPSELERRVLITQCSTSRMIDRLEDQGLVKRKPFPGDTRRQLIAITPEGRTRQQEMWTVYAASIQKHVGSKLKKKEAESLAELLRKLLE